MAAVYRRIALSALIRHQSFILLLTFKNKVDLVVSAMKNSTNGVGLVLRGASRTITTCATDCQPLLTHRLLQFLTRSNQRASCSQQQSFIQQQSQVLPTTKVHNTFTTSPNMEKSFLLELLHFTIAWFKGLYQSSGCGAGVCIFCVFLLLINTLFIIWTCCCCDGK